MYQSILVVVSGQAVCGSLRHRGKLHSYFHNAMCAQEDATWQIDGNILNLKQFIMLLWTELAMTC